MKGAKIITVPDYKHTQKIIINGHMNQRYNDNTKSPKLQDTQQGILQLRAFCQKIQQSTSFPGESTGGVTHYLS